MLLDNRVSIDTNPWNGPCGPVLDALFQSKRIDLNFVSRRTDLTPLMFAIFAGNTLIVTKLLDAGADPNAPDIRGKTPIQLAVERAIAHRDQGAFVECVRMLAGAKGVRLDVKQKDGKTPLGMARDAARQDLTDLLLKQG